MYFILVLSYMLSIYAADDSGSQMPSSGAMKDNVKGMGQRAKDMGHEVKEKAKDMTGMSTSEQDSEKDSKQDSGSQQDNSDSVNPQE